jgi:hypothetical protein
MKYAAYQFSFYFIVYLLGDQNCQPVPTLQWRGLACRWTNDIVVWLSTPPNARHGGMGPLPRHHYNRKVAQN